jgi:hypothetical protein
MFNSCTLAAVLTTEVGAVYWTDQAPDIVNFGRKEQAFPVEQGGAEGRGSGCGSARP